MAGLRFDDRLPGYDEFTPAGTGRFERLIHF